MVFYSIPVTFSNLLVSSVPSLSVEMHTRIIKWLDTGKYKLYCAILFVLYSVGRIRKKVIIWTSEMGKRNSMFCRKRPMNRFLCVLDNTCNRMGWGGLRFVGEGMKHKYMCIFLVVFVPSCLIAMFQLSGRNKETRQLLRTVIGANNQLYICDAKWSRREFAAPESISEDKFWTVNLLIIEILKLLTAKKS